MSAREVAHEQSAKFAAMQGLYETTKGADMVIFSLPPTQNPAQAYQAPAIVITQLLSFLTFGSFDSVIKGLQAFPPADWPPGGHHVPRVSQHGRHRHDHAAGDAGAGLVHPARIAS